MKLEAIHHKVIFLLVAGNQTSVIAKKVKVSVSTIQRWQQDKDFNLALQKGFSKANGDAIN